jgi:hypothetical protein
VKHTTCSRSGDRHTATPYLVGFFCGSFVSPVREAPFLRCSRSPLPPPLLKALTGCPTLLCGLDCTGAEWLEERVMSMLRERALSVFSLHGPLSLKLSPLISGGPIQRKTDSKRKVSHDEVRPQRLLHRHRHWQIFSCTLLDGFNSSRNRIGKMEKGKGRRKEGRDLIPNSVSLTHLRSLPSSLFRRCLLLSNAALFPWRV